MPPTPDRTTIRTAIDALFAQLTGGVAADPPTDAKPFRSVLVGATGVEETARPFLSLSLSTVRIAGVVSGDKIFAVAMSLRVVTDVTGSDPHAGLLDKIGAVEDFFDGTLAGGVAEGVEGFDDRIWKIEYPTTPAGARVAVAMAQQSFIVKVEREQNRLAAG